MDQNVTVDNDLQKAIDDITQNTNADPVFSDPVAAPSSVPEGDTGELAAPVGPFPTPEPILPETPATAPTINFANPAPATPTPVEEAPAEVAPVIEETPVKATQEIATEAPASLNMKQVKEAALRDLIPLLDRLPLSAKQKFDIYHDIIEELHDYTAVEHAYHAAAEITDDTERAEALLYLVESIDKM